jgi:ADP-heptose:LPS heptosyltransferase
LLWWETLMGYAWYAVSAAATSLHATRWPPGTLRRVLVIKTDHIGDFLLCLPPVRDFLRGEPDAEVGFVVGTDVAPLAERVPWIDEVHVFDSARYVRRGPPSPDRRLREILEGEWDLVVDLTNDRFAAAQALRRPSRYRRDVGTYRLREKATAMLGRGPGLRAVHATTVFYRALGMTPPEPVVPEGITCRDDDVREADRLLSRGWPGTRPVAALHAGAPWEHRRWPGARFAELARRLEQRGLAVFLVGGPNDREVSAAVALAAGLRPERNLAGEGSLPVAAAVLERAVCVCANDGGLMHLAVAQGTPTVGIFGPQDPALFGPLGASSAALWRERDCAPCSQRHCVWGRARCLEPIEVDDVVAALDRLGAGEAGR